jgi:hypothetical protein
MNLTKIKKLWHDVWHDPVWSKVISGLIVALVIFIASMIYGAIKGLSLFVGLYYILNFDVSLIIWICLILILYLFYRISKLSRYVAITFKDNFKRNLTKNWDYTGRWELVQKNQLLVTASDIGGITKVGQLWCDYRFEFDVLIVNDRIGWIVRAQDLFNYYMIQLTNTHIRPHIRFAGRWVLIEERTHNLNITTNVSYHICTDVRSSEITVKVDGQEVYYNIDFFNMKFIELQILEGREILRIVSFQPNTIVVPAYTSGRVGFRMDGAEQGRVSHCRVKPI